MGPICGSIHRRLLYKMCKYELITVEMVEQDKELDVDRSEYLLLHIV